MTGQTQNYELLLRVRADLLQAINGMKGLTDSFEDADAAAIALEESADAAELRIQRMVQATAQQAQAQESARSLAERAAQTANTTIKSYDDQVAAIQRATTAAAAYRASSGAATGGTAAVAGLEAERAAMAKLAGQINPTVAALAKLDAQETQLNALRKAGVVGLEDYTTFKTLIDQSRVSITNAAGAMHTFSLNTSNGRLELGRLIKDAANGNFGRLQQTLSTLASQAGFTSILFSPLGLLIAGVTAAVGGYAVALIAAQQDQDQFNTSIAQTGNYAGVTANQLQQMAVSITRSNGSVSDSRTILNTLVASGKVGAQSLQSLGQAAVDMAALTGESADKAAAAVLKMFDGTAKGALQANEQFNFLTTGVYDQIKALEAEGDTQQAMDVAAQAFDAAAVQRQKALQEELSATASWWDKIKAKAASAWEAMKSDSDVAIALGLANQQQQIDDLLKRKAAASTDANGNVKSFAGVFNNMVGLGFGPQEQAQLDALQAAQQHQQQAAADQGTQQQLNKGAVDADAGLDRLADAMDSAYAKKDKVKELTSYFNGLWAGADPNNPKLNNVQRFVANDGSVSFSGGLYDQLLAWINKAPKGAKPKSTVATDNAAASAQASLVKMLGDEQGAVDPVAKVWATYNDAVTKANDLVATAIKGKGANVDAIHAERDAVVQAYATARDAALSKLADADRVAFEKLRDSLKDVNGVSLGKAVDQIKQLNSELAKGTITPDEYKDNAQKVVDQSIPKLPDFVGADENATGPFGEVDKLAGQTAKLQEAYTKQLDVLNQFHDQALLSDQQFVDDENALYTAHAGALQKIDDARTEVMLAGITSSLDSAAQSIKEGFGEQSTEYRAAFALSKAAAIAQGTVALFSSILKASDNLPYPENLVAMAAVGAQGAALLAQIASVSAGFSGGGFTGNVGIAEVAGVVHGKEHVTRAAVVAQPGARGFLDDFNKRGMAALYEFAYPGYAMGGFVNSPMSQTSGFGAGNDPSFSMPDAVNGNTSAKQRGLRIITTLDPNAMRDYMSSSEGEQVIMQTLGRNRTTLKTYVAH
jgi:hypothetical protein